MSEKCYFSKLESVQKSKNADKMLRATVQMNEVWVGLDDVEGDTGVFFYPDCVLSDDFQDVAATRRWDDENKKYVSYLKGGRVKAVELRKERSEGLFVKMSASNVCELFGLKSVNIDDPLPEGDVYKVWKPKVKTPKNFDGVAAIKVGEYTSFPKHMDTSQFKAISKSMWSALESGGLVSVSLKIHGTSSRAGYVKVPRKFSFLEQFSITSRNNLAKLNAKACKFLNKIVYHLPMGTLGSKVGKLVNVSKQSVWQKARNHEVKLLNRTLDTIEEDGCYDTVYGTRNVIMTPDKVKGGYHDPSFRDKSNSIRFRLNKDEVVYFEVLGYEVFNSPIMATYKDKPYDYGIPNGDFACQVYRITQDGKDLSVLDMEQRCEQLNVTPVLRLTDLKSISDFKDYSSFIDFIKSSLIESEKVNMFEYRCDRGGVKKLKYDHTNEGIVVRLDTEGQDKPMLAKWKTFQFTEEEGITFQNIEDVEMNQEQG